MFVFGRRVVCFLSCVNSCILIPITNSLQDPGFQQYCIILSALFPITLATVLHVHFSFSHFSYFSSFLLLTAFIMVYYGQSITYIFSIFSIFLRCFLSNKSPFCIFFFFVVVSFRYFVVSVF